MKGRIKLKKGKQKELIESVKVKFKFTWKNLARKLKCNEHYLLHELRNEKRTLSTDNYKKLCRLLGKNFDQFIEKKLEENWGQVKGGKSIKNRKNLFQPKKPKMLCCNKSEKLAEIIGIMIGDGSIYTNPKKSIYQVNIAGNLKDECDYMLKHVKPLFEETFKIKMNVKKTKNAIYIWKQSKDLVFTLNNLCIPTGNKKINKIKIPDWIMKNEKFIKACLRGIFDTDGCLYPKNKTHTYPTVWFSSSIPSLQKSIAEACARLELKLSNWRASRNDAYLRTKEDVFKFFKMVSFNNRKHLIRWKMFNKAPVV